MRDMLQSLDSKEITEWMALYNIEHDEQERAKMEAEAARRAAKHTPR